MNTKTLLNLFAAEIVQGGLYEFQRPVADMVVDVVGKMEGQKLSKRRELNFLRKCGVWTTGKVH